MFIVQVFSFMFKLSVSRSESSYSMLQVFSFMFKLSVSRDMTFEELEARMEQGVIKGGGAMARTDVCPFPIPKFLHKNSKQMQVFYQNW
jgi:hypothetical protein